MPLQSIAADRQTFSGRTCRLSGWSLVAAVPLLLLTGPGAASIRIEGNAAPGTTGRRPLASALAAWRVDHSPTLRLSRELREQKVTVTLPRPHALQPLLENIGDLLQAGWRKGGSEAEGYTLERRADVKQILAARSKGQSKARADAIKEQEVLLRAAYGRATIALGRPEEQIAPGLTGRPGVVPGSEPLLSFLGTLTPAQWERLASEPQFIESGREGTHAVTRYEPVLVWPLSSLTRGQQDLVRQYCREQFGGHSPDYSRMIFGLASRGGTEITALIFDRYWGQQQLVLAPKGPALKKLLDAEEEPAFAPGAPAFAKGLPPELLPRAGQIADVNWNEKDYAEVAEALSGLLDAPTLADYYTLRADARVSVRSARIRLSELFDQVHQRLGCWFAWQNGMLLMRRPDWPRLDEREIPEEVIHRSLATKRERGLRSTLELPFLSWLAFTLTDRQIPCLLALERPPDWSTHFHPEVEALNQDRDFLRLYGRFSAALQRRLFGDGIRWSEAYRSAPREYLDFTRRRTRWFLNTGDGVLRLRPADVNDPTVVVPGTMPKGRRPLEIQWLPAEPSGSPFSQVTSILWPT